MPFSKPIQYDSRESDMFIVEKFLSIISGTILPNTIFYYFFLNSYLLILLLVSIMATCIELVLQIYS